MRAGKTNTVVLKWATRRGRLVVVLMFLGLTGCEDTAVNAHLHTSVLDITTSTENNPNTVTQRVTAVSAPDERVTHPGPLQ